MYFVNKAFLSVFSGSLNLSVVNKLKKNMMAYLVQLLRSASLPIGLFLFGMLQC